MAENEQDREKTLDTTGQIKDVELYDDITMSEDVILTDKQRQDLSYSLQSDISSCYYDKEDIMNELIDIRKSIHIEKNEKDRVAPFSGASNYTDTLTASHTKIVSSIMKRTVISNPVWLIDLPFQKEYERWLNESFGYCTWNFLGIEKKLRDAIDLCVKEFVSFIEVYDYTDEAYHLETETYLKGQILEFKKKYPSYKFLGLENQKQYNTIYNNLANQIDEFGEGKINLYRKRKYHKIGLEVRNLDEIFIIPWDSTSTETAKGIFSRITKTDDELREAARIGYYNKEAVEMVLNSGSTDESDRSDYKQDMDDRFYTEDDHQEEYFRYIYQGTYRFVLDENKGEESFYIHFDYRTRIILRIERYQNSYLDRNIISFSILPEHNRIWGSCLAKDLENSQSLVNTMYNQIIDNNHIANIPIFKASKEEMNDPDSSLYKRRFNDRLELYPGKVVSLKNPGDFDQMRTSPLNLESMLKIINTVQRSSEVMDGATQLQSGRENPSDPTAPARKTELQLSQSTLRIDDYVREIRPAVNKLGRVLLGKYINIQPLEWKQYQIKFNAENRNSIDQVARRPQDLSFENIIIDIKAQSVMHNKDSITREVQFVLGTLMQVPQLQANPMTIYIMLDKFLANLNYNRSEIDSLLSPLKQAAEMQSQMENQSPEQITPEEVGPQPPQLPIEIIEEAKRRGIKIEKPIAE